MTAGLLRAAGEASLSAAVMILAVLALRARFQDRTPRRAFCLLWDIVLARLLVLGALPSPVSVRRLLPETESTGPISQLNVASVIPEAGVTMYWERADVFLVEDTVASGTAQILPPLDWGAALTGVWLAAALLLAGGFLWNHLRSRKVYAASLPARDAFVLDWLAGHPLRRPVQARTSDRIAAPLTYGVLYPVILLPRGMDWTDREALDCVLAHEQAHIRRFDALRKALLAAALCLHWFNPLVWVLYVLAGRDIELACDEAVLRGGADRERYALALLGMEERRGRWSPSGSHFSGHALEERIREIMRRKRVSAAALAAVVAVMSAATAVFACTAPEKKQETVVGTAILDAREDYRSLVTYADSLEDGTVVLSKEAVADQEFEGSLFARYAEYGLVYKPRNGVTGALRFDEQPVCFFADALPGGGSFRYEDPSAEGGVELYGVYGENGELTGLMAVPDESEGPWFPSREEVESARKTALAGMSGEAVKRLNRVIIEANLRFEHAYLYGNVFARLEDPESLTWNYFEQTGEIQVGWAGDGAGVVARNDSTAYDFADLIGELRETVQDEDLRTVLQTVADLARRAAEEHSMTCANELYKTLHDLDYFLLRYGPAVDEGSDTWIQDKSTVEKYYGTLPLYG